MQKEIVPLMSLPNLKPLNLNVKPLLPITTPLKINSTVLQPTTISLSQNIAISSERFDEDDIDDDDNDDDEDEDEIQDDSIITQKISSFEDNNGINLDGNKIFYLNILEGYTFRQLIDFYIPSGQVALFIYQDYVIFETVSGDGTLMARTIITGKKLLEYKVKPELFNNKLYHLVKFDLSNLKTQLTSISKPDRLILYQLEKHQSIIIAEPYSQGKNQNGRHIIFRTSNGSPIIGKPGDDVNENTNPNCIIPLEEFTNNCQSIIRTKFCSSRFMTFENGFTIAGIDNYGRPSGDGSWGNVDTSSSFFTTNISSLTLKYLIKTKSFCNKGHVDIYAVKNNLIRFHIPLNFWGQHIIILKGQSMEELNAAALSKKKKK